MSPRHGIPVWDDSFGNSEGVEYTYLNLALVSTYENMIPYLEVLKSIKRIDKHITFANIDMPFNKLVSRIDHFCSIYDNDDCYVKDITDRDYRDGWKQIHDDYRYLLFDTLKIAHDHDQHNISSRDFFKGINKLLREIRNTGKMIAIDLRNCIESGCDDESLSTASRLIDLHIRRIDTCYDLLLIITSAHCIGDNFKSYFHAIENITMCYSLYAREIFRTVHTHDTDYDIERELHDLYKSLKHDTNPFIIYLEHDK